MRILLKQKGITNVKSVMTESPQFSVWRGCIIYGYAVPEDYEWNWERMEGWNMLGN
jgi:crenactin